MSAPVAQPQRNKFTLFVAGLPVEATEDSLMRHIKQIDSTIQLKNVSLLRSHETMQPRGIGFLELATVEDSNTPRLIP